jgi:NitT/TauT family transport system substrate-binding protein
MLAKRNLWGAPTLVLLCLLVGCKSRNPANQTGHQSQNLPKITLRQEWFANANFAGAALASKEFGADHHIELSIQEGSENVDPVTLVAAGQSDFGDAAADRVLAAISKGAPLVIVGVVNVSSPTVFLALEKKNIRSPRDFENHKVGILTGSATEYVYRALLDAAGVNRKKITEVQIGFDLQSFIAGAYDVRPAFDYDETVSLDRQGIKYTTIAPKDYGVRFIGTVYFTRRKMLKSNPQLVQNVVSALADGWRLAIADPKRGISAVKEQFPAIDEDRELQSLERAIPYIKPPSGKPLLATPDDWIGTLNALRRLHVVGDMPIGSFLDDSFVQTYYDTELR